MVEVSATVKICRVLKHQFVTGISFIKVHIMMFGSNHVILEFAQTNCWFFLPICSHVLGVLQDFVIGCFCGTTGPRGN